MMVAMSRAGILYILRQYCKGLLSPREITRLEGLGKGPQVIGLLARSAGLITALCLPGTL